MLRSLASQISGARSGTLKRAGNGEKFLLPLQIKLAKGADEIV
jgi:hypothetical protein